LTTVQCLQIYFQEEQIESLDPSFKPYDARHNKHGNLCELAHYIDILDNKQHRNFDYTGLLSHKFKLKTGIDGKVFLRFIEENPGRDVYFINPYPQMSYISFNIWEQGELFHPGITNIADQLFEAANLDFRASKAPRMDKSSLCYCNFWVGSANFWEDYVALLKRLLQTILSMPEKQKNQYFKNAAYIRDCNFIPFIIERTFSTYLLSQANHTFLAFDHEKEQVENMSLYDLENEIASSVKPVIDEWDQKNCWDDEKKQTIQTINQYNKAYYDIYFKHHAFPF